MRNSKLWLGVYAPRTLRRLADAGRRALETDSPDPSRKVQRNTVVSLIRDVETLAQSLEEAAGLVE